MCRNRVDVRGRRCNTCWAALASHKFWPARLALAKEMATCDLSGEDVEQVTLAWELLMDDPEPSVRHAAVGEFTPAEVLALMATDTGSKTVRRLALLELGSRKQPAAV